MNFEDFNKILKHFIQIRIIYYIELLQPQNHIVVGFGKYIVKVSLKSIKVPSVSFYIYIGFSQYTCIDIDINISAI